MPNAKYQQNTDTHEHGCAHSAAAHHTHDHNHGHGHDHSHGHFGHHHDFSATELASIGLKLKVSTGVTILFVIAGIIAGIYSNSLALISDAAHNFTDSLALILALFAVWIQSRPASSSKTYGYHRAGILAAFINSSTLMLIVAGIIYGAIERIITPTPVETGVMFWIAVAGLIVNIGIGLALHRESKSDITIRSAYIHMLGDAAGTVGIIIASLAIRYTGYWVLDPIISVAIGLLILWTSWDILKETVNLLLEGTPKGIDVDRVSSAIKEIPGVRELHHLHIWGIASRMTALSCHLQVDDMNLSHCQKILHEVNSMLKDKFHIDHATLQLEIDCAEEDLLACQPMRNQDH